MNTSVMKIHVKNMEENKALLLEEELDARAMDLNIGVMQFPEPVHVSAEAWKSGEDLTVQAHVETDRKFACSNCLEEFHNLFEKDITLHYDIKGLDTVTIDTDIREELLLEHPIRILCRPDCRGLCSRCGANLNNGPCGCTSKTK